MGTTSCNAAFPVLLYHVAAVGFCLSAFAVSVKVSVHDAGDVGNPNGDFMWLKYGLVMVVLVIDPFDPKRVQPNSVDLTLDRRLLVYRRNVPLMRYWEARDRWRDAAGAAQPAWAPPLPEPLDMRAEEPVDELLIPDEGLVLWPGVLYLGSTVEYTEVGALVPLLEGRSGVARAGLFAHVTAGWGDAYWAGTWTLELTPVVPLRVYAGVAICQLGFEELVGEPQRYAGKYRGARGPRPSGLWREFV
jgi:dCTP deaminase